MTEKEKKKQKDRKEMNVRQDEVGKREKYRKGKLQHKKTKRVTKTTY
jgi:hypothetical protein